MAQVYSCHASAWVNGKITELLGDGTMRVQYTHEGQNFRKKVALHSELLRMPATATESRSTLESGVEEPDFIIRLKMTLHIILKRGGLESVYQEAWLDRVLQWCDQVGIEEIIEIVDDDLTSELLDFMSLEAWQADLVEKSLVDWCYRRAGAPSAYHQDLSPARSLLTVQDRPLSQLISHQPRHGGNRVVPPNQWGMTVKQFSSFLASCRKETSKWKALEATVVDPSGVVRKRSGVSGHQMCESFVKPFTRGTGCSVALLLNPDEPLEADVMISHTWAEDISEVEQAINDLSFRDSNPHRCDRGDLVIWFCLFANYQAGDEDGDPGPTMKQQLARDPFGSVIRSPHLHFMCLAITTAQDPYERLWCVYELAVALDKKDELAAAGNDKADSFVVVEFSGAAQADYKNRMQQWADEQAEAAGLNLPEWRAIQTQDVEQLYYLDTVRCQDARCSKSEDREMIRRKVEAGWGWERLNKRIAEFRRPRETLPVP